jgi:hypothetical protein
MMALYIWLVWQRTRGDGGRALADEEALRAEKLMRFVRVGLMVASVVLVAAIILASSRGPVAGTEAPAGGPGTGLAGALRRVGGFFGLGRQAAALPFFVIVGTAVSYGYTIVASAKVFGFFRWMRHRRGA